MKKFLANLNSKFWIRLFLFIIALSIPAKIILTMKGFPGAISDTFAATLMGLISLLIGLNNNKKKKEESCKCEK